MVGGVIALGVIAGMMLVVYLLTRTGQPVGEASTPPTDRGPTPRLSSEPSAVPTTSTDPTPTIEPTATPIPSGPARIGWRGGGSHDGYVNAVVRHGDQWVAGGHLFNGTTSRAAVWVSDDGMTWSEAVLLDPQPVQTEGFWSRYWIVGFGTWNGDLLAFGWSGIGCCDGGRPMLWRATGATTWEVVDSSGTPFGDDYHVPRFSVIAPDGRLAVLSGTGLGASAALYLTDDLATWEMHPIPEISQPVTVTGLAASPSRLLAVSSETVQDAPDAEPRTTSRAWVSTDARTWSAIALPAGAAALADVAWDSTRERFVAVGDDEAGLPRAWLTTDGARWSSISLGTEPVRMQQVVSTDALIVAGGTGGSPIDPASGDAIAWSSHDGITWWYGPVVDGQATLRIGVHAESAVLIANRWTEADGDTWTSRAGSVVPLE